MRSLLSGTARVQGGAYCRVCFAASGTIVRRPSTEPDRRKVSASDVFTSSYSATMATATATHANAYRLSEARASLACSIEGIRAADVHDATDDAGDANDAKDTTSATSATEAPWRMPDGPDGVADILWSICSPQSKLQQHQAIRGRRRAYQEKLRRQFRVEMPDKLKIQAQSRKAYGETYTELVKGLAAEECAGSSTCRAPKKPTHVKWAATRILDMTNDLMREAYEQRYKGDTAAIKAAMENPDSPWMALRLLRSGGYPQYKDVDDAEVSRLMRTSNDNMRALFDRWQVSRRTEVLAMIKRKKVPGKDMHKHIMALKADLALKMVAKICYNLLVLPVRPDTHIYNNLLLGFTRLQEHTLAGIVVGYFLRRSRFRPTRLTMVCLLYHYQATSDVLGFYHMIRRMIGRDLGGMKLRRKPLEAVLGNDSLRAWASTADVAEYQSWIVERAQLDSDVFEALLKGLIYFDQGQHAAQVLSLALAMGFAVQTRTLIQLLSHIVVHIDHGAASVLIRGLCANIDDITSLLLGEDCPDELPWRLGPVLDFYAARLSLTCTSRLSTFLDDTSHEQDTRREKHLLDMISSPYPPPLKFYSDQAPSGLRHLVTALWIKESLSHIEQLSPIIRQITEVLTAGQVDHALSLASKKLERIHSKPARVHGRREATQSMGRFHIMNERVQVADEKLEKSQKEFLATVSETIPRELRDYILRAKFSTRKQMELYHLCQGGQRPFLIDVRLAIRESEWLVQRVKNLIAQRLTPERRQELLTQMGTWRQVPIELLCLETRPRTVAVRPARFKFDFISQSQKKVKMRSMVSRIIGVFSTTANDPR